MKRGFLLKGEAKRKAAQKPTESLTPSTSEAQARPPLLEGENGRNT